MIFIKIYTNLPHYNNSVIIGRMKSFFLIVILVLATSSSAEELYDKNHFVIIPKEMQVCATDDDCDLVARDCGMCFVMGAIKKTESSSFRKLHAKTCSDYDGKMCTAEKPDVVARCIDSVCTVMRKGLKSK